MVLIESDYPGRYVVTQIARSSTAMRQTEPTMFGLLCIEGGSVTLTSLGSRHGSGTTIWTEYHSTGIARAIVLHPLQTRSGRIGASDLCITRCRLVETHWANIYCTTSMGNRRIGESSDEHLGIL